MQLEVLGYMREAQIPLVRSVFMSPKGSSYNPVDETQRSTEANIHAPSAQVEVMICILGSTLAPQMKINVLVSKLSRRQIYHPYIICLKFSADTFTRLCTFLVLLVPIHFLFEYAQQKEDLYTIVMFAFVVLHVPP